MSEEKYEVGLGYFAVISVPKKLAIHAVITSALINGKEQADDYRIKMLFTDKVTLTIALQDGNGQLMKIPDPKTEELVLVNDHFALPVEQLGGGYVDSIGVDFVNSVAKVTLDWDKAGEYKITEEGMNMYLTNDALQFIFSGLAVSAYRSVA